jgi:Holliday junction DNA helicase RuvA
MIGRLNGALAIKRAPQVLIECHGVGYEVDVSMTTFYLLPAEGEAVSLWTHLVIKDDQHSLIGFYTEQERRLFRQLIRVNGVGPKMALTILSGISDTDFALCVQANDVSTLTRLPGVGKKTAERLIIEMRDKLDTVDAQTALTSAGALSTPGVTPVNDPAKEAIEALQALGYKPADAERMIRQAARDGDATSAGALIKLALRNAVSA